MTSAGKSVNLKLIYFKRSTSEWGHRVDIFHHLVSIQILLIQVFVVLLSVEPEASKLK